MKTVKNIISMAAICALMFSMVGCFGSDKFAQEVEKEKGAVKLVREIQRGGYDVITTQELKGLQDKGEEMVIIDTMPYEASYKKEHVPGAKQFLFPHSRYGRVGC